MRCEVLERLLRLNHERHAEEVAAGLVDANGKAIRRNGKNGKRDAKEARGAEAAKAAEPHLFKEQ